MTASSPICLGPDSDAWPAGWCDLPDPPTSVHATGSPDCLGLRAVAIVGTRSATPRGLAVARRLGHDLASRGWVVVSGLAFGIDAAAHEGALEAGGLTVAVMGTPPERTYPHRHRSLRRRIEADGCVVTETPPGQEFAGRWVFPRRNRLIAGMVEGVIVVEAPDKSGALGTATVAGELGRTVWAVPGPVDQPGSVGCHQLIREGALLCEGAADVDRVLSPPRPGAVSEVPRPEPGSAAAWILDRIGLDGTPLGELRVRWPGTDAMWHEGLLALELAGLIRRLPGGVLAPRIWIA